MADLLTVSHLKKYFSVKGGDEGETTLKAVDDISFSIAEGETLGLVGESGCGKSTVGKCLVRLYEPTDGQIVFQGTDITHLSTRQIRPPAPKHPNDFPRPVFQLRPPHEREGTNQRGYEDSAPVQDEGGARGSGDKAAA